MVPITIDRIIGYLMKIFSIKIYEVSTLLPKKNALCVKIDDNSFKSISSFVFIVSFTKTRMGRWMRIRVFDPFMHSIKNIVRSL